MDLIRKHNSLLEVELIKQNSLQLIELSIHTK